MTAVLLEAVEQFWAQESPPPSSVVDEDQDSLDGTFDDSETSSEHRVNARTRNSKPYRRPSPSGSGRDAVAHNTVEKRRRAELTQSYARLKACLPALGAQSKASNVMILRSAASYIAELHSAETSLRTRLLTAREHHSHLQLQLNKLWHAHADASEGIVPDMMPGESRHVYDDGFQTAPCTPTAAEASEAEPFDGLMLLADLVNQSYVKAAALTAVSS